MITNKTRLAFLDVGTSQPHQYDVVLEFDVYQEAIDYVETAIMNTGGSQIQFLLFNYNNPSFQYSISSGGVISKVEIDFPQYVP